MLTALARIFRRKPVGSELVDLARAEFHGLVFRCAEIIRGEAPGRGPREIGDLPYYGQAQVDGRALVWSGPFGFDLEVERGLYAPLPGEPKVFVSTKEYIPGGVCFIVAPLNVWATLWPKHCTVATPEPPA